MKPVHILTQSHEFPPADEADETGILAIGGDMNPDRILNAYKNGIFPWFSPWGPILWWSPDPRFVLYPEELKISKSMRPLFNQARFRVSYDTCFEKVISACAETNRKDEVGTWINKELKSAFIHFHELGLAHSVEVWSEKELVGGLYGLSMGSMFFGESMFSRIPNASKFGFITLVNHLKTKGISLIDCQVYTSHLESLGAKGIPRQTFLELLSDGLKQPGLEGKWEF